ncbi:putative transcription factor MYB-HB-like family [Helianthus annuus]|nr:putative transcription factor MYB-HB-like family [Helianthus annuus]
MTNPSANNNNPTITTNGSIINGGCSTVPEYSDVGPSERALKHKNISLSKVWTCDEQSLLEELLTKYASDSKVMRYAKIAPKLQNKTMRDVALRCIWMTKKVADHQQVKPSSHATNHSNGQPYAHLSNSTDSDDTDSISYEDIGGESGQLIEENVQAMKQISANFSSLKVHENIDLFSKIRDNIVVLLKASLNDMCEMMKNMPPLPFKLNDKLANSIIIPESSSVPMEF